MNSDDLARELVRDASDMGEELDTDVARTVAGWWHGGQGSAFYAFSSSGHYDRDDLLRELSRTIEQCYASADEDSRLQLDMLGTYFLNYTPPEITSVWSSFGHRFIGDGEGTESCLTCGAVYQLVARADDPTSGDYTAANGDDPMECSRDTGMAHGYPGERVGGNADHDCNCLLCA